MNKRNNIIISIVGITIVALALLGITYAYYLTRIEGNTNNNSISVTTADLKVSYGENSAEVIVKENALPGEMLAEKSFTITNDGTGSAEFSIILDNIENSFQRNLDLKYVLTKDGESESLAEGNIVVGTHQILIPRVSIEEDEVLSYTLTLNYLETGTDQSIDMGSTLKFRVNISEPTLTWDTASEGSLLYAIKNGDNVSATLGNIEDDYGISYYFIGDEVNNYVKYSDKIWRIIRVQGDGTIKIALNGITNNIGSFGYSKNNSSPEMLKYENSILKEEIELWKTTSNLNTAHIVETDWCNDLSIARKEFSSGYDINDNYVYEEKDAVIKLYHYYYGANAEPILKCNIKGIENSKSIRIRSDIATLTRDEIVLSEILIGEFEASSDSSSDPLAWYWLMTPYDYFDGYLDDEWYFPGQGYFIENRFEETKGFHDLSFYETTSPAFWARPAIVLKNDVILDDTIENQNGSLTNPYVIKE